jgi:hypothetical protein
MQASRPTDNANPISYDKKGPTWGGSSLAFTTW